MKITNKLTMDLTYPRWNQPVMAVREDRGTRMVELTLMEGDTPWTIPEDACAVIRYCKSDGLWGEYDTLPDGTGAWSASENVLTVSLAPQVLTTPGLTRLEVTLYQEGKQLTTFPISIQVAAGLPEGQEESGIYVNVLRFLPVPQSAKAGEFLQVEAVDEFGRVVRTCAAVPETGSSDAVCFTQQELTEEQKAQARKNICAAAAGQMELIRQFQLTEDVSSMSITTDDAGNAFRLESAIMTLTTDGNCAEGSSGAVGVNFGTANDPYFIRWYNPGGFPWRGYQLGENWYRNSGFTVWGSAKGGVLLTIGQAGDLGSANGLGMVLYPSYSYNPDVKIERITVSSKLPANATVKIYGERVVEE